MHKETAKFFKDYSPYILTLASGIVLFSLFITLYIYNYGNWNSISITSGYLGWAFIIAPAFNDIYGKVKAQEKKFYISSSLLALLFTIFHSAYELFRNAFAGMYTSFQLSDILYDISMTSAYSALILLFFTSIFKGQLKVLRAAVHILFVLSTSHIAIIQYTKSFPLFLISIFLMAGYSAGIIKKLYFHKEQK